MKKRIYLLILIALFATACTTEYKLEYKDSVFTETLIATDEITKENSEGIYEAFGGKDSNFFKKKNGTQYDVSVKKDGNKEVLTAVYKYDGAEKLKDSKIFDCFDHVQFEDEKDYYLIRAWGDYTKCPYVSEITVGFDTDMKVLSHNADKADDEKGAYQWTNVDDGIEVQISKKYKLESKIEKSSINIRLIAIAIALLIGAAYVLIQKRVKRV